MEHGTFLVVIRIGYLVLIRVHEHIPTIGKTYSSRYVYLYERYVPTRHCTHKLFGYVLVVRVYYGLYIRCIALWWRKSSYTLPT